MEYSINTQLKRIFKNMWRRCYNENHKSYKYYGGKGITICDEWLEDINKFVQWGIDNGYEPGLTIERIDNNKNYCPSNCCFLSNKQQQNHRSNNHYITYNNETHTLTEWAEITGIKYYTLKYRICRAKWSIEKALCRTR